MARTIDTIEAIDGAEHDRQDIHALRDDELDLVSGGDVYMHSPRGSSDRTSGGPDPAPPPILRCLLHLLGL